MLEPDDGKLSSPVLRGLAPSNGGRPLGSMSRWATPPRGGSYNRLRRRKRTGGNRVQGAMSGRRENPSIARKFVGNDIHRLVRETA